MFKKLFAKIKKMGVKSILLLHFGILCCALASVVFISPAKIVASGATGLAKLISMLVVINGKTIDFSYFLFAINFILILISFPLLGKEFTIKTIYGSILLPLFDTILLWIFKLFDFGEDKIAKIICQCDPVFVVIFASVLMGFGIGIAMKQGGSTGGFDILETIFNKYFHLSFTTSIFILDALLIIFGMVVYEKEATSGENLFANGLDEGLGATAYVLIIGFLIDTISFGGYNKRAVFITSSKYEELRQAIFKNLGRGLTLLDAKGGYSKVNTEMIICICYSKEYYSLRECIDSIDPHAFVFATRATEVRGLGFTIEKK